MRGNLQTLFLILLTLSGGASWVSTWNSIMEKLIRFLIRAIFLSQRGSGKDVKRKPTLSQDIWCDPVWQAQRIGLRVILCNWAPQHEKLHCNCLSQLFIQAMASAMCVCKCQKHSDTNLKRLIIAVACLMDFKSVRPEWGWQSLVTGDIQEPFIDTQL